MQTLRDLTHQTLEKNLENSFQDNLLESQYLQLPFIINCLAGVLLLTALRDYFLAENLLAGSWYAYYGVGFLVLGLAQAVRLKTVLFERRANTVAAVCAMTVLLIPTFETFWNGSSGVLYMAISLLGVALVVVSTGHLLTIQAVAFLLWITAVAQSTGIAANVPAVVINTLAIALGIVIFQRRLASLRHVFDLETRIEALESILPMCSNCKKTRDEEGNWQSVETYLLSQDTGLSVSHGICPECRELLYGDARRNT